MHFYRLNNAPQRGGLRASDAALEVGPGRSAGRRGRAIVASEGVALAFCRGASVELQRSDRSGTVRLPHVFPP